VSNTCLVCFENNKYSVLARTVGRLAEVQAYAERLVFRQGQTRPRNGRLQNAGQPKQLKHKFSRYDVKLKLKCTTLIVLTVLAGILLEA
jgi:hypothetical protein